jgi:hypothetical protein
MDRIQRLGLLLSEMDRDQDWRDALAACPEVIAGFQAMTGADTDFQKALGEFRSMWPIFKAQQLRAGRISAIGYTRADIVRYYLSKGLDIAPPCFEHHRRAGQEVPADWPHTLSALYPVRCNLFHGEKSPHSEMDAGIVYSALQVLVRVITPYIL